MIHSSGVSFPLLFLQIYSQIHSSKAKYKVSRSAGPSQTKHGASVWNCSIWFVCERAHLRFPCFYKWAPNPDAVRVPGARLNAPAACSCRLGRSRAHFQHFRRLNSPLSAKVAITHRDQCPKLLYLSPLFNKIWAIYMRNRRKDKWTAAPVVLLKEEQCRGLTKSHRRFHFSFLRRRRSCVNA